MKIQLDTKNKTIKIEEEIKLSELFTAVKKLLPEDWKEFTLQTNTIINNWCNPIIWANYGAPIYRQSPPTTLTPELNPYYYTNYNTTSNIVDIVENGNVASSFTQSSTNSIINIEY